MILTNIILSLYLNKGYASSSNFALTITSYFKGVIGISPNLLTRLASIVLLFSGILLFDNIFHIQLLGSEIVDYSGLSQVTVLSSSLFTTYPNKSKFSIINHKIIRAFVYKFWKEIIQTLPKDRLVVVIFNMEFEGGVIRSFSRLNKVGNSKEYRDAFYSEIKYYFDSHLEGYSELTITNFHLKYRITDLEIEKSKKIKVSKSLTASGFKPENLPLTMNLWEWDSNISFSPTYDYAHFTRDNISFIIKFVIVICYYCAPRPSRQITICKTGLSKCHCEYGVCILPIFAPT